MGNFKSHVKLGRNERNSLIIFHGACGRVLIQVIVGRNNAAGIPHHTQSIHHLWMKLEERRKKINDKILDQEKEKEMENE